MAKHSGKNGKVIFNDGTAATAVGLKGFSIDESTGTADTSDADGLWKSHATTQSEWKGSIDLNLDHAGAGQDLRSGDELAFSGYTEGDATGKTY